MGAEWCGQCLAPLQERPLAAPQRPHEEPAGGGPAAPVPEPAGSSEVPAAQGRQEDGAHREPSWICGVCGTANPLANDVCDACGSPFALTIDPPKRRAAGTKDPGTAAIYSMIFPGAGHAWLGLWGQGWARAILSVWVIVVAVIGALGAKGSLAILIAGTFALCAFLLWIVAAHDAYREAADQPAAVLLTSRRMVYTVVGLLVLLMVLLAVGTLQAASSG